jgi:hypothetical protein
VENFLAQPEVLSWSGTDLIYAHRHDDEHWNYDGVPPFDTELKRWLFPTEEDYHFIKAVEQKATPTSIVGVMYGPPGVCCYYPEAAIDAYTPAYPPQKKVYLLDNLKAFARRILCSY